VKQGKHNKSSWVFTSRLRQQSTNNDPSFYKLQATVKLPKTMEVQENSPSEMHKSRKAMLRAAVGQQWMEQWMERWQIRPGKYNIIFYKSRPSKARSQQLQSPTTGLECIALIT
jgi:hypothetical protein